MSDREETYGAERERQLLALLRSLAARIAALDRAGQLLAGAPELMQLLGEARSELFAWEVRSTWDTPEVAESRRIVDEATTRPDFLTPDPEDDEPWRHRSPE